MASAAQFETNRLNALASTPPRAPLRRLLNDLRQFQSGRWLRAEVLRDGFDEQHHCIRRRPPRYQAFVP